MECNATTSRQKITMTIVTCCRALCVRVALCSTTGHNTRIVNGQMLCDMGETGAPDLGGPRGRHMRHGQDGGSGRASGGSRRSSEGKGAESMNNGRCGLVSAGDKVYE